MVLHFTGLFYVAAAAADVVTVMWIRVHNFTDLKCVDSHHG